MEKKTKSLDVLAQALEAEIKWKFHEEGGYASAIIGDRQCEVTDEDIIITTPSGVGIPDGFKAIIDDFVVATKATMNEAMDALIQSLLEEVSSGRSGDGFEL